MDGETSHSGLAIGRKNFSGKINAQSATVVENSKKRIKMLVCALTLNINHQPSLVGIFLVASPFKRQLCVGEYSQLL